MAGIGDFGGESAEARSAGLRFGVRVDLGRSDFSLLVHPADALRVRLVGAREGCRAEVRGRRVRKELHDIQGQR